MAVTGGKWQKLTLGKLIPNLDPDKEGSAAHRINCEIGKITAEIDNNLNKVTNVIDSVSNTLKTVGDLGDQLAELQNQIEDLITNTMNTGVFMHTIGLNPIFSLTSPGAIAQAIAQHWADTDDPSRPVFKGDNLASIGGILVLVSAPSVPEMKAAIERLGTIFPVFKVAIEGIVDDAGDVADVFTDDFLDPITTEFGALENTWDALKQTNLSLKQPFTDLYDQAAYDMSVSDFEGWDSGEAFVGLSKWYALRLSDLIPALDVDVENSPAKLIVDAERSLVNGGAALLQQVGNLSNSLTGLTEAVNFLNRRLQKLASDTQDLVRAVSQTGLYVHTIGLDGSVHNSQEFVDTCNRALHDVQDSDRPRAAGQMQAFAGMQIVFGAANPMGLSAQFKTIGNVFGGLDTNIKGIGYSFEAF